MMISETNCRKKLVLVVEDDFLLRMDAVLMIEEAGFDVLEAANADDAIMILERRFDIDVVFTDIDMPNGSMNGLRLAMRSETVGHRSRSNNEKLSFLILQSSADRSRMIQRRNRIHDKAAEVR